LYTLSPKAVTFKGRFKPVSGVNHLSTYTALKGKERVYAPH